jgi:prolipoprotein diacylglyceryltransferase
VRFPVYIAIGSLRLHPHLVFETLAYCIGFYVYLRLRRRRGDVIADATRWSIVTAAIAGASIGSKVLYWFEDPAATWQHLDDPIFLMQGKTIVGGLLGGVIGVEATKFFLGVREFTGDLFAIPLAIGIAVGRIVPTAFRRRCRGASISGTASCAIRRSCTRRLLSRRSQSLSRRSRGVRTRTATCSSCSW